MKSVGSGEVSSVRLPELDLSYLEYPPDRCHCVLSSTILTTKFNVLCGKGGASGTCHVIMWIRLSE